MIEVIIKKYLEKALGLNVFFEYPEKPPDSFVLITRSGTNRSDYIMTATFILSSYAKSNYSAGLLNESVIDAMDSLQYEPEVMTTGMVTSYPAFDENNHKYRYQAVYNVIY